MQAADLTAELVELRRQLAHLRRENARLLRRLELVAPATASPAGHVAVFAALFAARTDVYALRWDNPRTARAGWLPATPGGWHPGGREAQRPHRPLTEEVIAAHLAGEVHLGLYPLLDGDRCRWLAAEFDGPAGVLDALAYLKAARAAGVPAAVEVSRSGTGNRVWIFFADPVPAATARRLGTALVREAILLRGRMDLSAYDRLFPSHDFLPACGGVGNPIGAPLHGARHGAGSAFVDLVTLEPHEDQWAYLSSLERMSPRQLARVVSRVSDAGPTSTRGRPRLPAVVRARLGARILVDGADLTPALLSTLKHAASLSNPLFDDRQRRRASTSGVPRFLLRYQQTPGGRLILPRGLLGTLDMLVREAGSRLETADERVRGTRHGFVFSATLNQDQQAAVAALAPHDLGVLIASAQDGTVVACALIAARSTATLVLVDGTARADHWRARLPNLLGRPAGRIGGAGSTPHGGIDVAPLQTLARRSDVAELTMDYGLVVVDECDRVPAGAFEHVVGRIPARCWLGLAAAPHRRDRLDDLVALQLGPVRHTMPARGSGEPDRWTEPRGAAIGGIPGIRRALGW